MTSAARWSSTHRISDALSHALGTQITLCELAEVGEGWTAAHGDYAHIRRCKVSEQRGGSGVRSVIVKLQRAGDAGALARERSALELLAELAPGTAPRLLAHGDDFVVLEDLGRGPAVEDLLIGGDRGAAIHALVATAGAVGRMHAATHDQRELFYTRLAERGVDPHADRACIHGLPLAASWAQLRELMRDLDLTISRDAERDFAAILDLLTRSDAPIALCNGDLAPQNNRCTDGVIRLLDFERASFQHVLLDAAQLRLPFCAAPCWARIPPSITAAMEAAFRDALSRVYPAILEPRAYQIGMAAATAAYAITRMLRLPKLRAHDKPHPMGFSRRGQLLDTLQVAVATADVAASYSGLRDWLASVIHTLRASWPGLPASQPVYPALRASSNQLPGV